MGIVMQKSSLDKDVPVSFVRIRNQLRVFDVHSERYHDEYEADQTKEECDQRRLGGQKQLEAIVQVESTHFTQQPRLRTR